MGRLWAVWAGIGISMVLAGGVSARETLPEFAYQNITVRFVRADGTPVAGAAVYGFCREFNLIWPRNDEFAERASPLWQPSFLAKTSKDGTAAVKVPPGKWGFFAAGCGDDGKVIAGWTAFQQRNAKETVQIEASVAKRWTFRRGASGTLNPSTIYLKPDAFPIWIPVPCGSGGDAMQVELSPGNCRAWVSKDASTSSPGFVLDCGTLSDKTADGVVSVASQAATIVCKGGLDSSRLHWSRRQSFGLEGSLAIAGGTTRVMISPAPMMIGYERTLVNGVTGIFGAELYPLQNTQTEFLDFETSLTAAIDQVVPDSNDKHGAGQILACLYLVDANGHLLGQMRDADGKPIAFDASVTVAGAKLNATHLAANSSTLNETIFAADLGSLRPDANAIRQAQWQITGPPGVLKSTRLTDESPLPVSSATFKTEVPQIVVPHTKNVLAQAELEATAMEQITGRKRRRMPTFLNFKPQGGASAGHNGLVINIGSGMLFADELIDSHTFAHELGHGFDFYHGGLHETVVELTRTTSGHLDGEAWQISQQAGKWFFFDHMNGLNRKEHWYHNTGLYLYFYAQEGPAFVHFMCVNEHAILTALEKQNYTTDEVTTALCNIAMKRDVSDICTRYGLKAEPDRVARATITARSLMR